MKSKITLPRFGNDTSSTPKGPTRGDTLADYTLLERIGVGPHGELFKARDLRRDTEVALKLLPPELVSDHHALTELEAFTDRLRAIDHPHVQPILDVGRVDDHTYIVTPLITGLPLRKRIELRKLQRRAFDLDEILVLLTPLADALQTFAKAGIHHGDIKPENILVTADGPLLTDFFVVGGLPFGARSTRFGHLELAHIAPEVIAGHAPKGEADVFSLAMITAELLTGRTPQMGMRPSEVRDDLDPALDALIRRATREDPHERYPSVDKLMAALLKTHPQPEGFVSSARLLDVGEALKLGRNRRDPGGDTHPGYPGSELEDDPQRRLRARGVTSPGFPTSEASEAMPPLRADDDTHPDGLLLESTLTGLPTQEPPPQSDIELPPELLDDPVEEASTSLELDAPSEGDDLDPAFTTDELVERARIDPALVAPPRSDDDVVRYAMLVMAGVLAVAAFYVLI